MDKVFLVYKDNGETMDCYRDDVVNVFSSYRKASEWFGDDDLYETEISAWIVDMSIQE